MLISPELLGLHEQATWQHEFGLNESSLKSLIVPIVQSSAKLLNVKGVRVCLFEKRQGLSVNVGTSIKSDSVFDALRNTLAGKGEYALISERDNQPALTNLTKAADKTLVNECFVCTFSAKDERIDGYVCFFGETINPNQIDLSAFADLLKNNICNALLLKKAKRVSVDQQEFYALVADTNTVNIFAKDVDSRIVFCNQSFLHLYPPESRDKVIGYTTVEEYDEVQRNIFLQDDRDAFETGFKSLVEVIDFPNGRQVTLETTKIKFTTLSGNDYILCIAYDLSKQYKLIRQLENKNRDLDKIANVLATDIRAPANAMINIIKWLQQDLKTVDNHEVHELVAELRKRSNRVNKLLSVVYKYAFAGRDKHVSTEVSLTSAVSDLLSNIRSDKTFTTSITEKTLLLPRRPFVDVLDILVRNAHDHHPDDHIKLEIDVRTDKNNYLIDVIDNGEGIEASKQGAIFELFFSSKDVDEDDVFGVGLAIAKRILQSYDGDLVLDAEKKKGTKITIVWPKDIGHNTDS
jgi:signal transduction histidine kinase